MQYLSREIKRKQRYKKYENAGNLKKLLRIITENRISYQIS